MTGKRTSCERPGIEDAQSFCCWSIHTTSKADGSDGARLAARFDIAFFLHPRERDVDSASFDPAPRTFYESEAEILALGKQTEDEMFGSGQPGKMLNHSRDHRSYNL